MRLGPRRGDQRGLRIPDVRDHHKNNPPSRGLELRLNLQREQQGRFAVYNTSGFDEGAMGSTCRFHSSSISFRAVDHV